VLLSNEQWKPIKDFPDYEVSDLGRVKSYKHSKEGRILSPRSDGRGGYKKVTLFKNGMKIQKKIHILVLEAFIGPKPTGWETSHKNDKPDDNRLSNLEWVTPSKNQKLNFQVFNNTLTAKHREKIPTIFELAKAGLSQREIGRRLEIDYSHVSRILRGERWK
jgi:hypothetical protein